MVQIKHMIGFSFDAPSECEIAYLPKKAVVSFCQGGGMSRPAVQPGDHVAEGQLIGFGRTTSCNVHAPVPGLVESFSRVRQPDGTSADSVTIHLNGTFSYLGKIIPDRDWHTLSGNDIANLLERHGIVNTFMYPVSLYSQIIAVRRSETPFLAVRLYDLDPTCCTDSFTFSADQVRIFKSAGIVAKAVGAAAVFFLCDDRDEYFSNPDDILALANTCMPESVQAVLIPVNTSKYPCGGSQEVSAFIKKANRTGLDFNPKNTIMLDPVTLYAVYQAVVFDIPLMERFVYVAGDGIVTPKMLKVRIGMTIRDLIEECGGVCTSSGYLIINGLIRGTAVEQPDTPVTKYMKSLYVVSGGKLSSQQQFDCVRCGLCRNICPARLRPDVLYAHCTGTVLLPESGIAMARECYDCGLCNMVCTARLPLNQAICRLAEKGLVNENSE